MHECAYCLLKSETRFEFLEFTPCTEMYQIDTTVRWVLVLQNEHASFLVNSTPGLMNVVANYYEHINTNTRYAGTNISMRFICLAHQI